MWTAFKNYYLKSTIYKKGSIKKMLLFSFWFSKLVLDTSFTSIFILSEVEGRGGLPGLTILADTCTGRCPWTICSHYVPGSLPAQGLAGFGKHVPSSFDFAQDEDLTVLCQLRPAHNAMPNHLSPQTKQAALSSGLSQVRIMSGAYGAPHSRVTKCNAL